MEFYFVLIRLVFWYNADLHAIVYSFWVPQVALVIKNSPANAGDVRHTGSMPGLGRYPGGEHSKPLQNSFLEVPWQRSRVDHTVHRITNSETWLFSTSVTLFLFSSVQISHSVMSDSATPWTTAHQASLFITNSQSSPKPMSIESVIPSYHLILCCPLLLLPSIFPSIRVFSSESALCIRWPRYWSVSFNITPSNEYPGLISFRMDWLDLLAVQGTLKSLLQHHSSKASILRHSAFFTVQLLHPYMTTGKTIGLTRWTFVDKVMSLLFNMLSRLVITFLPRSKCLLISWLQ